MKILFKYLTLAVVALISACKEKYAPPIIDPGPIDTFAMLKGDYEGTFNTFNYAYGSGPNYHIDSTVSQTVIITEIDTNHIVIMQDASDLHFPKLASGKKGYYGIEDSRTDHQIVSLRNDSLFYDEGHSEYRSNNTWQHGWGATGRWKKIK
ncbi:MAG: hypothetical protein EOP51_01110 [Sphingobacteriales bacterium]|nr:MAG: hypothetical protein EOP51_01110 [Sphingobacteriales bacterium]